MITSEDERYAKILVERGFVSQEKVDQALNDINENMLVTSLLDLLVDRGIVKEHQVQAVRAGVIGTDRLAEDRALAQQIVERGLAPEAAVRECLAHIEVLRAQGAASVPRLAQLLLSKGIITETQARNLSTSPVPPATAPPRTPTPRVAASPVPPAGPRAGAPPPRTPTPRVAASPVPPTTAPPRTPTPRASASPVPPATAPPRAPTPRASSSPVPPVVAPARTPTPRPTKVCTFCGMIFQEGETPKGCSFCNDPYHEACWAKTGGCVKPECQAKAGVKPRAAAAPAAPARGAALEGRGPLIYRIVVLVVLLAAGGVAWKLFHHDAKYYLEEGRAAMALGPSHADEAIQKLRLAVEKDPRLAEAWIELGSAQSKAGHARDAQEALQKGLDLQPDATHAMFLLAAVCEKNEDYAAAEKWYRKGLEASPDDLDARTALGTLYDEKIDHARDRAAVELRKVFDKRPQDADLAVRLAGCLIDQKKYEEAREVIDRSLATAPGSEPLRTASAQIYYYMGQYAKAVEVAAKLPTNNWAARKWLAMAWAKQGNVVEARAVANEVARFAPDPEIKGLAGLLEIQAGTDVQKGLQWAHEAMAAAKDPDFSEQVGDALVALQRWSDAKDVFESLRAMDPKRPKVDFKYALALLPTLDREKAEVAMKEVLTGAPGDPDLQALDARRLREAGDSSTSLERLRAILGSGGKTPYVYLQLGLTLRTQGNIPMALEAFRNALHSGGCPDALYELGMTYVALKNEPAWRDCLGRYVKAVPLGNKHEQAARVLASKAGAPPPVTGSDTGSASQDCSSYVTSCRATLERLAKGHILDLEPYDEATAWLQGSSAMLGILCSSPPLAGDESGNFMKSAELLMKDPTSWRYRDPAGGTNWRNTEVPEAVKAWNLALARTAAEVVACAKRRDRMKTCADEVASLEKGLANSAAMSDDQRLVEGARSLTAALRLLVFVISDAPPTQSELLKIETEHRMQADYAYNPLQKLCMEVFTSVRLANLLVQVLDTKGAYAAQRASVMQGFDGAEMDAKKVFDQLDAGAKALCQMLWIAAADPALRP